MQGVTDWLHDNVGLSLLAQTRLLATAIALVGIALLRRLVVWIILRRVDDVRTRYRTEKISRYVATPLLLLIIGRIWFEGIESLATFFGLLSAGLAIALKDPIVNIAGWLFIVWRRPFSLGDRIEMGALRGDVIDLRLFQFTLLEIGNWVDADQSTGRLIHIPNGQVFTQSQANYSAGFAYIWNEIPVLVTFESDWRKAKELLLEIAHRHAHHQSAEAEAKVRQAARRFMIFYNKLTPIVYTSVKDSGVMLTIRYLCQPRRRRGTAEAIWEDILAAFARYDTIDFAYPTQRFYSNRLEGKPGTVPGAVPPPPPDDVPEGEVP